MYFHALEIESLIITASMTCSNLANFFQYPSHFEVAPLWHSMIPAATIEAALKHHRFEFGVDPAFGPKQLTIVWLNSSSMGTKANHGN